MVRLGFEPRVAGKEGWTAQTNSVYDWGSKFSFLQAIPILGNLPIGHFGCN